MATVSPGAPPCASGSLGVLIYNISYLSVRRLAPSPLVFGFSAASYWLIKTVGMIVFFLQPFSLFREGFSFLFFLFFFLIFLFGADFKDILVNYNMVSQSLCGKRAFKICQTDGAKSNRPIDKTGGNWGLFVTAWTSCQKKPNQQGNWHVVFTFFWQDIFNMHFFSQCFKQTRSP